MSKLSLQPANFEECLISQGDAPYTVPAELFCNVTWDSVLCWPPTLIGSETKLPCPKYLGLPSNRFATKSCGRNGKWIGKHPGTEFFPNNFYPGWTNYSECTGLKYDIPAPAPTNRTADSNFNASEPSSISVGILPFRSEGVDILSTLLLILSLTMILASVIITFCTRGPVPTRKKLYRNCFAAFLVHDSLELVIRMGRIVQSEDVVNDVETCVSIGVLVTLSSSAIYTWMTIISVYFTLTKSGIAIENKMYYVLCLLGWFIPTVITIIWLSVTVLSGNLKCINGELEFTKPESGFWIIEGINVFLISLSWLLLILFLWKYKHRETHRRYAENKSLIIELVHIRQSAYKMLIVLCYITSGYIIYVITAQQPLTETTSYILVVILFSRGVMLSVFMCLLEDSCKCWDGVYSVDNITESEASLAPSNTSTMTTPSSVNIHRISR